jgi:hypothetical protein
MSETYRAQCRWEQGDYMTVHGVGSSVQINAYQSNEFTSNAQLDPDDARTFGRGILALADEVDEGEDKPAKHDGTLPVGTRVRVLKAHGLPWATGKLGTVYALTDQPGRLKVHVDEPSVGFLDKFYADRWEVIDEPAPRSVKVGDRVRVVRNTFDYEDRSYIGRIGTLKVIDADEQPYKVAFDNGGYWWCAEVELVDEAPDAVAAPEPLADWERDLLECVAEASTADEPADVRETFIRRAAELAVEVGIYDGDAIVSMARFLAGE